MLYEASTAATAATPTTAAVVDHLMTQSADITRHHQRPARTQQSGCIGYLVKTVLTAKPPGASHVTTHGECPPNGKVRERRNSAPAISKCNLHCAIDRSGYKPTVTIIVLTADDKS